MARRGPTFLAVAACAAPERPGWVRPDLDPAWLSAAGDLCWPTEATK